MLIKTYLAWGFAVLAGFAILGSTGVRVPRPSMGAGGGSSPGYYGGHGSGGYGGSSGFGWGK